MFQGQLDYDIQLMLENDTIIYNTDKQDQIKALVLPNQIYGKWPKKYTATRKPTLTQKWTNKIINKAPSNKTVQLLVADSPVLSKSNIYDTITLTQDLVVNQATTGSGNEFYEYTFSTYSYEGDDGYVTEIQEIESGNIRQTIRRYPICAFISSPYAKYPLIHWNNQLQTVPYILNSIHGAMVSTNQQILQIQEHQKVQDNNIAKYDDSQIKAIVARNNSLENKIQVMQQQMVTMHNTIANNTSDIADLKDTLRQTVQQMHNVQVNIYKGVETVDRTTTPPTLIVQQVDFTQVNTKIKEIKDDLLREITELKQDTKTDISTIRGEMDTLRQSMINCELRIDYNKKEIDKLDKKDWQSKIDAMKQQQLVLGTRFIQLNNKISDLEDYDQKIEMIA